MAQAQTNAPRKTMLLTGASRGIGHATVKRFSSAGWRGITCSRHAFPEEECPWMAGPQDHLKIDLADPKDTRRAIAEVRERLEDGRLDALVNNAAISPKGAGGSRLGLFETELEDWQTIFQVNFFAPMMLARGLIAELSRKKPMALDRQRHLDRRRAGASFRRRRLFDVQSRAGGVDARNGRRPRPARRAASTPFRRARSTPRSCRRGRTRSSRKSPAPARLARRGRQGDLFSFAPSNRAMAAWR